MDDEPEAFSIDVCSLVVSHVESPLPDGQEHPLLSVYLASALTNQTDDERAHAGQARKIIADVLRACRIDGVRFQVYDPADITPPGSCHSACDVYKTDHRHAANADLEVFFVLGPSTGIGIESQIAAESTVPRVVVTRRGVRVSRIFTGQFNPTLTWVEYENVEDLRRTLASELHNIVGKVVESSKRRRPHREAITSMGIGRKIFKHRLRRGLTRAVLADLTDIRTDWIEDLERDESRWQNATMMQLSRLVCEVGLNLKVVVPNGEVAIDEGGHEGALSDEMEKSLEHLAVFSLRSPDALDDGRIVEIWWEHANVASEDAEEAVRHRTSESRIVTVEEWKARYRRRDPRRLFNLDGDDDGAN